MPSADEIESPTTFIATTLAKIEAPQFKLKGAAVSVAMGIEQVVVSLITEFDPSQFVRSAV